MSGSFIELCLSGDVGLEDIDRFIEDWHKSSRGGSLASYLGLSDHEYALWVERPGVLPFILLARRYELPLESIAELRSGKIPLAARAPTPAEADRFLSWLKKTGRVKR